MKTKTDVKAGHITIVVVGNVSTVHQSSKGAFNAGNSAMVAQNAQIGSNLTL